MPFYRFDQPDGTSSWAHVLIRPVNKAPLPCVFPDFENPHEHCARQAVALCDFPVGLVMAGAAVTCDRPMCARHRTRVGDNVDHCPNHVTKEPSHMRNVNAEAGTAPEQEIKEPTTETL